MLNAISDALEKECANPRTGTTSINRQYKRFPEQKHVKTWCNFDRMISKLNEDDVNKLSITIGKLIADFKLQLSGE